jgi:hypothetical protein
MGSCEQGNEHEISIKRSLSNWEQLKKDSVSCTAYGRPKHSNMKVIL